MSLARRSVAVFCAKAILLVFTVGALHPRCAGQRTSDISGAWEVSGGYHFLAETHLWITMQVAGPPKAVLYSGLRQSTTSPSDIGPPPRLDFHILR